MGAFGRRALNRAHRSFEVVFIGPSEASVVAAVKHGLGIAALARSRAERAGLEIWDDAPLPAVGDLFCGIYLGESGGQPQLEKLADAIFDLIGPKSRCTEGVPLDPEVAVVRI